MGLSKCLKVSIALIFIYVFSCSTEKNDNASLSQKLKTDSISADSILKAQAAEKKQLIEDYALSTIDTLKVGDVDGNGKKDIAYILPYNVDSNYVYISFNCDIPFIKHHNGFSGYVVNLGDLDGNKTEELLYCPHWFQSNSGSIFVYGYKNNAWLLMARGSIRRDILYDKKDPIKFLKSRVKKINNSSFQLISHLWRDADIVDSTETITIE